MSHDPDLIVELQRQAKQVRQMVVEMIAAAGSGHPGGGLSAVEILTVLYHHVLQVDPARPDWPDRDRFVLSKGHGAAGWYAALCTRGYFPREWLGRFRQIGGKLVGHPDMRKAPGVDMSSGSLGQGLSAAIGMALAARYHAKDYRSYVLLGDGEIQEGQIWEAAMAAPHFQLDNLTAILDLNGVQLDGNVADIMPIDPVVDKWQAFGWHTIECADGHDIEQLLTAFDAAQAVKSRPAIIIAHTVKGKGVSFMEHQATWHGVSDPDRLPAALEEVTRL
ncbi:MAG: transketolase [Anaerolineae bacterium CG2_30_64_16]|nr:MAG: transketolase [Anaerolineae bacterium CG2_30_64_16]